MHTYNKDNLIIYWKTGSQYFTPGYKPNLSPNN